MLASLKLLGTQIAESKLAIWSVDNASLLISVLGLGLSILAFVKSRSAVDIAKSVTVKAHEQVDTARLRSLLGALQDAKKAAKRRRIGAPSGSASGYTKASDLRLIQEAQDALMTRLPIEMADEARTTAENGAIELDRAFQSINNPQPSRDGWKDALVTLQTVIPELEREERRVSTITILRDNLSL